MAKTLTGTYTSTYNLTTPATQNPFTITSTGLIDVDSTVTGVVALLGAVGYAWNVVNLGTVESIGNSGLGVEVQAGGLVVNGQTGLSAAVIEGSSDGIRIGGGTGTVDNYGTIHGYTGIYLGNSNAGLIINHAGGVITGTNLDGVIANNTNITLTVVNDGLITTDNKTTFFGVGVLVDQGQAGTVDNLGTISVINATGINLEHGGKIANGQSGSTSGLILGNLGIFVTGGAATISNYGTISGFGTSGDGIQIQSGIIHNYGTISSTGTGGDAIQIDSGGTIYNHGLIDINTTEAEGTSIFMNSGGLLVNYGTISGAGNSAHATIASSGAVVVHGTAEAGTIRNFGTIMATATGANNGIDFDAGGKLYNGSSINTSAQINGYSVGVVVGSISGTPVSGAVGFIYNYGTIAASSNTAGRGISFLGGEVNNHGFIDGEHIGVVLGASNNGQGSLILNSVGGTILGGDIGVYLTTASSNGTVVNSGTIIGTAGTAISLGTTGTDLVVIASTAASLQGVVANVYPGDAFDLPFLAFSSGGHATVVSNGSVTNQLQIVENSGTFAINLDTNQNFSGDVFQLGTDGTGGTLISENVKGTGGFLFAAAEPVNLVLTPDGSNLPPAVAGDFNLEIFTTTNGTLASGYQGSAFAPGGVESSNGNVVASSITLGPGDFEVVDTGGNGTINAGSGDQSVVGGAGDTIVGGSGALDVIASVQDTVLVGDNAARVTVDITKGFSLVDMGAAGGTVFAGNGDTVNNGSGSTSLVGPSNESLTLTGVGAGDFTVAGASGSISGNAGTIYVGLGGIAGDTVTLSGVPGDTVAAAVVSAVTETGANLIDFGSGTGEVFTANGDTVNAGSGTVQGVGPSNETLTLDGTASGSTYTVAGATGSMSGGADTIYVGLFGIAGDTVTLGAAADATVSAVTGGDLINLGSGPSTVFAGNGDTVNTGAGTVVGIGPSTEELTLDGVAGSDYTVAGAGGSMSGGAADVYIGLVGVVGDTVTLGAVMGATVAANQGGELINLGSGPSTVFASGSDTVNAGSGSSLVQTPNLEAVTVSGASTTDTFAVDAVHFSNIVSVGGTAATINAVGAAGDTISTFGGSATVNAQAGAEVVKVSGLDSVFAGPSDTIGIGPTGSGSQLFLQTDSTVSVGFGTFDSATGSSTAKATVGTVVGGKAVDGFNLATDFVFYQNESAAENATIIASRHATSVDGVTSSFVTLPDGSTMTFVGVTVTELKGLGFK